MSDPGEFKTSVKGSVGLVSGVAFGVVAVSWVVYLGGVFLAALHAPQMQPIAFMVGVPLSVPLMAFPVLIALVLRRVSARWLDHATLIVALALVTQMLATEIRHNQAKSELAALVRDTGAVVVTLPRP